MMYFKYIPNALLESNKMIRPNSWHTKNVEKDYKIPSLSSMLTQAIHNYIGGKLYISYAKIS